MSSITKSTTAHAAAPLAFALVLLIACAILVPNTAYAQEAGSVSGQATGTPNLAAAQAKYDVDDSRIITVEGDIDLKTAFKDAAAEASDGTRFIVYAPSGTHEVGTRAIVPENVVLVGEDDTVFTPASSTSIMMWVSGSIYGGYFDGNNKTETVLRFSSVSFADGNGVIEKATVTRGKGYGIVAMTSNCRNSKVINCAVVKNGLSGISILNAAYMSLIDGCNVSNNKTAGVNLSHADVGTINKSKMNNNGDKGVSTNSDPIPGYDKPGCDIGSITNCVVNNNKANGVYLKPYCTLKKFTGNTVCGNKLGGLSAVGNTDSGTHGPVSIKNVSKNTFKKNGLGQIRAIGKGAKVSVGNGNSVSASKQSGLFARDSGVITVGSNNKVFSNTGAGLNAQDKGKIAINGKGNKIYKNKAFAVYCVDSGKVALKKASVEGRIYTANKGKVTGGIRK